MQIQQEVIIQYIVLKTLEVRDYPWFVPPTENVICAPNGNVDDFLTNLTVANFVKT